MTSNLKERILHTASNLFYTQGINSTGVDSIVKAAGTTKMSLYKYFPSKDDLVLAHLRKSGAQMRMKIGAVLNHPALAPRAKLLAVFDVFDELLALPEFRGCPLINASAEYAIEGNPVQKAAAEFYDEFRRTLAEMARQAEINNSMELACQLVLLITGAIVTEQLRKDSEAMKLARHTAKILIEGSKTSS
ncbi:MAG: TetR/AcrR family transcriptional regulator [Gammaproteobacteria bacterium]